MCSNGYCSADPYLLGGVDTRPDRLSGFTTGAPSESVLACVNAPDFERVDMLTPPAVSVRCATLECAGDAADTCCFPTPDAAPDLAADLAPWVTGAGMICAVLALFPAPPALGLFCSPCEF